MKDQESKPRPHPPRPAAPPVEVGQWVSVQGDEAAAEPEDE